MSRLMSQSDINLHHIPKTLMPNPEFPTLGFPGPCKSGYMDTQITISHSYAQLMPILKRCITHILVYIYPHQTTHSTSPYPKNLNFGPELQDLGTNHTIPEFTSFADFPNSRTCTPLLHRSKLWPAPGHQGWLVDPGFILGMAWGSWDDHGPIFRSIVQVLNPM